jgi:hypothetical protein
MHAELREDVLDVTLHGQAADVELGGDVAGGPSVGKEPQDLPLATGERPHPTRRLVRAAGKANHLKERRQMRGRGDELAGSRASQRVSKHTLLRAALDDARCAQRDQHRRHRRIGRLRHREDPSLGELPNRVG